MSTSSEVSSHPLADRWVLWKEGANDAGGRSSTGMSTADEWKRRLAQIIDVDTVETFWRVFNHLERVDALPPGVSYNFFRESVQPLWEDPANADGGGRWYFRIERPPKFTKAFGDQVHQTWLCVLMSLIGNKLDFSGLICGAVSSSRPREMRFMVWVRKGSSEQLLRLGTMLKKNLPFVDKMTYRVHTDRRRTGTALYC